MMAHLSRTNDVRHQDGPATEGGDHPPTSSASSSIVHNFRPATGLIRVYRCGAPDRLGELVLKWEAEGRTQTKKASLKGFVDPPSDGKEEEKDVPLSEGDRFLLYDATLVIDLRRAVECSNEVHQAWVRGAPGGSFTVVAPGGGDDDRKNDDDDNDDRRMQKKRVVMNVDLVGTSQGRSATELAGGPDEEHDAEADAEAAAAHMRLLIAQVNEKGMIVLFERMLRDSKDRFFLALRAVTVHLEDRPDGQVVLHCTQGKDRTGLVVMLLQSALGVPDRDIVADFAKSSAGGLSKAAHQAVKKLGIASQVNPAVLSAANPMMMENTLALIREQYGSVPQYLDGIGFDEKWRQRLQATQTVAAGGRNGAL